VDWHRVLARTEEMKSRESPNRGAEMDDSTRAWSHAPQIGTPQLFGALSADKHRRRRGDDGLAY
jgi:hypothetical protein